MDSPHLLQIHGQKTNTEFLGSGPTKALNVNVEKDPESRFISAMIGANIQSAIASDIIIYDRKHDIDLRALQQWVGYRPEKLGRDLLEINRQKGVCFVRHSEPNPSPIVKVLESLQKEEKQSYSAQPITFKGEDALMISLPNVQSALQHIDAGWRLQEFTDFSEIKATFSSGAHGSHSSKAKPPTITGKVDATGKKSMLSGSDLGQLFGQGEKIRLGIVVQNTYVAVSNNDAVQQEINGALDKVM
jgi:hypothetical protein